MPQCSPQLLWGAAVIPGSTDQSQLAALGLDVVHDFLEALQARQLEAGAVLEEDHHVCRNANKKTLIWIIGGTCEARQLEAGAVLEEDHHVYGKRGVGRGDTRKSQQYV